MNRLIKFDRKAFGWFSLLFAIEVLIAVFVRDRLIRPFVGDVLVVMLIFFFLKSFLTVSPRFLAIGTLAFAWTVEFAQYFQFVRWLGLEDVTIARIVLGSTFDWLDLVAYTLGTAIVLLGYSPRSKKVE